MTPHILLVNQFYGKGATPTARMAHDLVTACANQGMRVTVVAAPDDYSSTSASAESPGVAVRWIKPWFPHTAAMIPRLLNYAAFWLQALVSVLRCPDVDLVICLTTPPLLGCLGALKKRVSHAKFVLWEMDLYPEALASAGIFRRESAIFRTLAWITRQMLRHADAVVALGAYQKELVERHQCRAPESRAPVHVIPPWDDREIAAVARVENRFLAAHELISKRVILYAGNFGRGHSFTEILEVSRRWKHRADVCFVFAGGGSAYAELRAFEQEQSGNFLLLGYQPQEWLSDLLTGADIHFVSMKPGWEGVIVPSKLFGMLKAGGAVAFVGPRRSETAEAVLEGAFGFALECGEVDELERQLHRCLSDPAVLREYQLAALRYHAEVAAPRLALDQWIDLIRAVIG